MKLKTVLALSMTGVLSISAAQAYMIAGGIEVGSLDTYIAAGKTANSNPETEIAEFASLGLSLTYEGYKTETVKVHAVINEADPLTQNYWAFSLMSGPGYYIVKNANGKKSGSNVILFENKSSFDWGVIEWSSLATLGVGSDLTISHVTEFNSSKTVAEPATLGLLALGATGLFAARRKQKAKA